MGFIEKQRTVEHPELYPELTRSEVRTLGELASFDIKENRVEVSKAQLARAAATSEATTRTHLKKLAEVGRIEIIERINPNNEKHSLKNAFILHLKPHPASCKNGRHIAGGKPLAPPEQNQETQSKPGGHSLTPGGQSVIPRGQATNPLNKDQENKDPIKNLNSIDRENTCPGCQGTDPNHLADCAEHPITAQLRAVRFQADQSATDSPESLTDEQREQLERKRKVLEILETKGQTLSANNLEYALTFRTDLNLGLYRAQKFEAAGYELRSNWNREINPWTTFLESDYAEFQKLEQEPGK